MRIRHLGRLLATFLLALLCFVGAGVWGFMQVAARDAATNFCSWLPKIWPSCNEWLTPWFDEWGFIGPLVLVVLGIWAAIRLHRESKAKRATLQIRGPYSFRDEKYATKCQHRVGVFNQSTTCGAEHVKMWLRKATKPKIGISDDLPYRVAMAAAEWHAGRSSTVIEIEDAHINAGEEERFTIADTWLSSDNRLMVDKIDTRQNGKNSRWIMPDEQWILNYEVTADNADPITFSIEVSQKNGQVVVQRNQ